MLSLSKHVIAAVGILVGSRAHATTPYNFDLPPGFPAPKVPADNPMTVEKVELGRFLFYDTRLSGNQTLSCSGCHMQERAFTDGFDRAVGSTEQVHPRGSMSLTNVAYGPTLGWANPLLRSLEGQALVPMFGESPVELGLAGLEEELNQRLRDNGRYRRMFAEAFPQAAEPVSLDSITKAIAAFERTLISGNSPYDRYAFGVDDDALSESALRGRELFFDEKFECHHCHGGFNFTGSISFEGQTFEEIEFQNNALYNLDGEGAYPPDNPGLAEFTGRPQDVGSFKAPTLRNLRWTAPYMHDGSIATLEEAIAHYSAGGRTISEGPNAGVGSTNPNKSIFVPGFDPTNEETVDVIAFLDSLNDESFVTNLRFRDPHTKITCPGDCNDNGAVSVDELIKGINMALGTAPLAQCVGLEADGDGEVAVNELIRSLNFALGNCP